MSGEYEIKKQIVEHNRRLQKLKEQQARKGIDTPPHVLTEIEDIETRLAELQAELEALPKIVRQNPYRGLSTFREKDADVFFGRETFTHQLVEAVQQKPLVAVLGPSGSGKSSIVFAGLIPHLRVKGRWLVASFRPGREPFDALAATLVPLLDPDLTERLRLKEIKGLATDLEQGDLSFDKIVTRILEKSPDADKFLLIADQFEELYTLCPEPEIRRRFLDVLLAPAEQAPLHLVLTLRADFMAQALNYRPFANSLSEAIVMLGPMETGELRHAIEKPAQKQDAGFQTGLVERILDDVSHEPGQLPLLEFALTALWEEQTQGQMTHEGYETIGRVEGALSRYADQVFESLSDTKQQQAHRVFVQLVRPGEGTEDTRRLARHDEFGEADWLLVQNLAGKRLVVTDLGPDEQETAEVVHEALIQNWAQLRGWLNEDRRFRIWQERLRAVLKQWQVSQHDEGALLRGAPLAEAEIWLDERSGDLTETERNFIQASISLRERKVAERAVRRRRERAGRFFRWLAVALSIILLLLAIRWGWSLNCVQISQLAGFGIHCPAINLFGINLFRADLSGVDSWKGAEVGPWEIDLDWNLSGANLSGADLSDAILADILLDGADLHDANLKRAILYEAALSQTDLSGTDLRGANLELANLRGADLRGANLSEDPLSGNSTSLHRANLHKADLRNTNLRQASLYEADLRGADLRGADLNFASLGLTNLKGAIIDDDTTIDDQWRLVWDIVNNSTPERDLNGVYLGYAYLVGANLHKAQLKGADLGYASLVGIDLSEAELVDAQLRGTDLSGAILTRSNLSEADLYGAILTQTNLSYANLYDANLYDADLRGADLSNADLRQAYLREANIDETTKIDHKWRLVWDILTHGVWQRDLGQADLSEADMQNAHFVDADLSGVDLTGADLRGADLSGANLNGADLERVLLTGCTYDGDTVWPAGIDPVKAGAKFSD